MRARSTSKKWDFVSLGTEVSVAKFVTKVLTPLTVPDSISDLDETPRCMDGERGRQPYHPREIQEDFGHFGEIP
jgi:hypothetical protein